MQRFLIVVAVVIAVLFGMLAYVKNSRTPVLDKSETLELAPEFQQQQSVEKKEEGK